MATVPEPEQPVGGIRIWATYRDAALARRAAVALEEAGVDRDRIAVATDAGTTEGAVARTREHREGTRIAARTGLGAAAGAAIGALVGLLLGAMSGTGATGLALFTLGGTLFGGGAGAFVGGIASLRSAAPIIGRPGDEAPGGAAVEVSAVGPQDRRVVEVLRRYRPTALQLTDASGRPIPTGSGG